MAITHTLIDDAGGKFAISGAQIKTAASSIEPGVYNIKVRTVSDEGWSRERTFTITVFVPGSPIGLLLILTKAA